MERTLERKLVERAKRGDMTAFEQLYRAHAPAVLARIIRPRVASHADQEDVLVDTFRTALEKLDTFRWTGRSVFSWLARIAANKSADFHRAQGARSRAASRLALEPSTPVPRPDQLLAAGYNRREIAERVGVILDAMRPRYAITLRLRLLEGRSRPLCATELNVSVATFDELLLRSVRAFRKAWLARYGAEDAP